uniref:Myosin motor domain-containing protein n=1 Tax=Hucho hucho TaxID=62062 RepID=A0A4W5LL90_9TELE
MILRGEEICSPLTVEQAVGSRDSVAMALYAQSFSWIITRINQKVRGKDNFKSIGILDIFGFENFEVRLRFPFFVVGTESCCHANSLSCQTLTLELVKMAETAPGQC